MERKGERYVILIEREVLYMSKSYKKYPIVRQEKEDYRILNRKLRHDKLADFPKGSSFKRHSPHWHSWAYEWTWKQAMKDYEKDIWRGRFNSLEEFRNYWEMCVLRK